MPTLKMILNGGGGAILHHESYSGKWREDRDYRRTGPERAASSASEGFHRTGSDPVRILHARDDHGF